MKRNQIALAIATLLAHPVIMAGEYSVTSVAVGNGPFHVLTADFNQDGKTDVLSTNTYSQSVSVLLGNGDNTFSTAKAYGVGNQPIYSAVADINQDGKLDVVTANMSDNSFSVLKGKGDGSFMPGLMFGSAATDHPMAIAIADFNLDGKADIAVSNNYNHSLSLWINRGNGNFGNEVVYAMGKYPNHVAVGDVNQDGRPDVVVSNSGSML